MGYCALLQTIAYLLRLLDHSTLFSGRMAAATATLSCSLHLPVKPLTISYLLLPISKNPILISGSTSNRRNRGFGKMSVSGASDMTEMVATSRDSSVCGDGIKGGEDELGEAEAILVGGSSSFGSNTASQGVGSTLNQLSKWVVAVLFGIVIVWKHDVEILWAAMGSVINVWFSVSLKKILNHQRPVPHLKSDPGMPSSHAQSIFYGASFLVLSLFRWLGINTVTLVGGTLIFTSSSYLSWLRVSQQFHTVNQVLVGAMLGSTCAALWFWSWHAFVLRAFISSIFVRIAVVLSSVISCVVFVLHVIRHWLKDDE